MTGRDEMYDGSDVHALSGAYAVDALDDDERSHFEAHLRTCSDCRAEVASLRETAAALGTDDVAPPAALRDQVLAGIETIRPLPPELPPEGEPDELTTWRRLRLPLLVAAAVAVLVAAAGTIWIAPWSGEDSGPGPTATERVLTADDADRTTLELADGAEATVVASRSVDRAVILTKDMPPAPEGKDYQLWLQNEQGTMVPAGLMPDDSDATVLLDGAVAGSTAVGITVEPDGGSPEPTTEPIAIIALDG